MFNDILWWVSITSDAGVWSVEVWLVFTTSFHCVHLVVRQADSATPSPRTSRISYCEDVDATLALRVHVADTPSSLSPVERVLHQNHRVGVARCIKLLCHVAVLAYLCQMQRHDLSTHVTSCRLMWRFCEIASLRYVVVAKVTRGQSNLTKSASRGAHSPVMGHPRGSKVVPLNSWGRVSY